MYDPGKLPREVRQALERGVLKRLPLTFLPFVNQQLSQWQFLFPNERQSAETLILYIDGSTPEQSSTLFREVSRIEEKMGIVDWHLSTHEQTIQNSSELARSPHFQEWRQAVQSIFDAVGKHGQNIGKAEKVVHRLILIDLPAALQVRRENAWGRWKREGRELQIKASADALSRSAELLLSEIEQQINDHPPQEQTASMWVIDAGGSVVDPILQSGFQKESRTPILLSYSRLEAFRNNFSHAMNTMRKDLSDADAVFDHLRAIDVIPWCPQEIADDPAAREFVRSLYLSGNGAVIFGNSFVEWGASEAFRRARPAVLAARFGVRAKPKPFTGVAVFDDPDEVNPSASVDDNVGSTRDAEILARYIWLAATRYPEYQDSTVCLCLAESIAQAYLIAPSGFEVKEENGEVSLPDLQNALKKWVA